MTQNDLLQLLHDIKQFDIQNLSLDLPQDIRARIERALIGWGDLTPEQKAAEQQKEIDRLRLAEKSNNERWQHENKAVERLALAAFSVLNHHESPECHFELKQALMAMGFCPRCEWRPCECGEDD